MTKSFCCVCVFLAAVAVLFAGSAEPTAESDELFAKGVDLYRQGRYREAIPLFEESYRIDQETLDSTSNRRDYSAMWLASCLYRLGDTVRAADTNEYYRFTPVDRRLTVRSDSLSRIGMECALQGDFSTAIDLFTQAAEIEKSLLGDHHIWYGNSLYTLMFCNASLGNYAEAVNLGTKFLGIMERTFGKGHPDYAITLSDLSDYNSDLGNYTEAIRLETEALDIREKTLGKNHDNYATSLNILAGYNYESGDYAEAIRLGTEELEIRERTVGKEHPDYVIALNNLSLYYSHSGNYEEAIRLGTEALGILERTVDKDDLDYVTSLHNLSNNYSGIGNYAEAIRLETEALEILKRTSGKEHPNYATLLNNLAGYNSELGDHAEAIRLGTEALAIMERTLGKEHPNYATVQSNLALHNASLGNYAEAIRLGTEALDIMGRTLGKGHPRYANLLQDLADYNSYIGNYAEAIRLGTEALAIMEQTLGKEHPRYANSLSNLSLYNFYSGNYAEALRLGSEALEIREGTLGKKHPKYAISLGNLALYNYALGNDEEAVRIGTEALEIVEQTLGKEHPDYAAFLSNLAGYNSDLKNYAEAIRLGTEALDIRERTVGKEHPDYATSLQSLTLTSFAAGDAKNGTQYCIEATQAISSLVRRTFADLTTVERSMFWDKYKAWFERNVHELALNHPTDTMVENGYNSVLLGKGLLLNSEMELNALLRESGDKEVDELYGSLRSLRRQINKLYEKPIAERPLDTDSLERVAQDLERELVRRSKTYGDFTRNLAIDCKQVRRRLGDRDLAVEFVAIPAGNDSVVYAAYCLKKGWAKPKLRRLFERRQLKAAGASAVYTTPEVASLVWRPLEEELRGADNVYFAPAGELYNIAVESVPYWEGDSTVMSDRWNFYRLSSTRQLAVAGDEPSSNEAKLYGGLLYDAGVDKLENDSRRYPAKERSFGPTTYNPEGTIELRAGANPLPGTKIEVEEIVRYLRDTGIRPTLYTDTIGTETSFKALSGNRPKMIHIATHGFYWTESDAQKAGNNLSFLSLGGETGRKLSEDKAMTRSGLLFTGANNALKGKTLPEGVDDGILTAAEIARLDLRGMDLAVLSACQTGLGEITGDGVFGLQRGFKKAGAQTLMMSLWKVDDNATRLLMTRFYANLIAGKSKYEALREAQRYLREYEVEKTVGDTPGSRIRRTTKRETKRVRPYNAPKYWAAFILLDAIDR